MSKPNIVKDERKEHVDKVERYIKIGQTMLKEGKPHDLYEDIACINTLVENKKEFKSDYYPSFAKACLEYGFMQGASWFLHKMRYNDLRMTVDYYFYRSQKEPKEEPKEEGK